MNKNNSLVDAYMSKAKIWKEEMEALREMLLSCNLTEELKWGKPCYSFENKNLFIIQSFKTNCALGFFKGELINDEKGLLVKPGENTQSGRMIRFTHLKEIVKVKGTIKGYIKEAIEHEKKGTKTTINEKAELIFPEELQSVLDKNVKFKKAFESLTPGRQRAYNMFFSAPKQAQTRTTRIEKYKQQILNGKGINDCTCGLSKKMPYCDGSHKFL
jgi:uncharacterized protein YdeI (YjbR/CyaY-like superfamily)